MVKGWLLTGLILLVTQIAMAFNETHLDQRCGLGEIGLSNPSTTIFPGTILYSGIYFATDLLNEKFGKDEANRAVMLGFVANIAVMLTLVLSTKFLPSDLTGSAAEVHEAISVLAFYSPIFIIGSLTAYLVSQRFDVWFFHYLKNITNTIKSLNLVLL